MRFVIGSRVGLLSSAKYLLKRLERIKRAGVAPLILFGFLWCLYAFLFAYYFLFSKSGFTKGCMEKANELGNVMLVEHEDMLKSYGM